MTVKELIERLSKYDGDLEVLTKKTDIFGNCGNVFSVKESTYGFFGHSCKCVIISDEDSGDEE